MNLVFESERKAGPAPDDATEESRSVDGPRQYFRLLIAQMSEHDLVAALTEAADKGYPTTDEQIHTAMHNALSFLWAHKCRAALKGGQ
jgi:hypothetical protein